MVFPHGSNLSINTRVITLVHTLFKGYENQGLTKYYPIAPVILSDMYRALGMCKEGHGYFQGCNLLLQWWILSHLEKGAGTRELHTLDNKNTLKDLNDPLYWANMNNRRTRGRWAQIFSELREEDLQCMLDRFISKEVIVESRRQVVLPLPGIRGIRPYAPFRVLRQFGKRQTVPKEAYYGTYVYDIGDDRVHDASEMFREWKSAKRMDKDTIAPDRFNAGNVKGYKEWLKKDIQNVFFQTPRSFRSVTGREAKAVSEIEEVKEEAKEVYAKFVENKDNLERVTQEVERQRRGYDDFDNWIKGKIERMRYESLEDKGRLGEGFLLLLRYMFQHHKAQRDDDGAGSSGGT
ncbi:uncharacterized protein LOC107029295 [Solanum pennellii]|uniref:Uncharacterized protein LOC107029295 n=1 Tax=Solanum pennellii TaxID=28526 RepID=A0ABM1HIX7_SOLPN|nr:uncharacterized protein LOC107029295 [Solanum pennellii]